MNYKMYIINYALCQTEKIAIYFQNRCHIYTYMPTMIQKLF